MTYQKTLHERERELQAEMLTPGGHARLDELAARYAESGGPRCGYGPSAITCILVHEREAGLIRL
jgi:hypothetical protein